jgi:hypothetical protein
MTPSYLVKEVAEEAGYVSMTTPYEIRNKVPEIREHHQWMLDRVIADMNGCDVVLVDTMKGPEVWRHVSELDIDENGIRRGSSGKQHHVPSLRRGKKVKNEK